MLKVVVFHSGNGGESVARFIESELPVEVIRVIDWSEPAYGVMSEVEIREQTEQALIDYIGLSDVIVLAEPAVAMAAERYLSRKYPHQKFVGYGWGLPELAKRTTKVLILTTLEVQRSSKYQMLKADCGQIEIIEPDCSDWPIQIGEGRLSDEAIARGVGEFTGGIIVIYSAVYEDIQERIISSVKWRAEVVNMNRLMMRDICKALELTGLDGRRPRERIR